MTSAELNRADKVDEITAQMDTLMKMICAYMLSVDSVNDRITVGLTRITENIINEIRTLR